MTGIILPAFPLVKLRVIIGRDVRFTGIGSVRIRFVMPILLVPVVMTSPFLERSYGRLCERRYRPGTAYAYSLVPEQRRGTAPRLFACIRPRIGTPG